MRMIRKIGLLSLLAVATLLAQDASATLEPLLPESSYSNGDWQGFRFYDEEIEPGVFLRGRIDFALYDTYNPQYQGEIDWLDGLGMTEQGRYVYAYQIFNDYDASDEAVSYFAIFGLDGEEPLDVEEENIGSYYDEREGIAPTSEYLSEDKLKAVWNFDGGLIYKDNHSWFLILASDSGPVPGDFEVKTPQEQGEPSVPIPEPAMIALLGIGSALVMCTKRRKSFQLVTQDPLAQSNL